MSGPTASASISLANLSGVFASHSEETRVMLSG